VLERLTVGNKTRAEATQHIELELVDGPTPVASIQAYIIDKGLLRGRWYEEMDVYS